MYLPCSVIHKYMYIANKQFSACKWLLWLWRLGQKSAMKQQEHIHTSVVEHGNLFGWNLAEFLELRCIYKRGEEKKRCVTHDSLRICESEHPVYSGACVWCRSEAARATKNISEFHVFIFFITQQQQLNNDNIQIEKIQGFIIHIYFVKLTNKTFIYFKVFENFYFSLF